MSKREHPIAFIPQSTLPILAILFIIILSVLFLPNLKKSPHPLDK